MNKAKAHSSNPMSIFAGTLTAQKEEHISSVNREATAEMRKHLPKLRQTKSVSKLHRTLLERYGRDGANLGKHFLSNATDWSLSAMSA